MSYCPTCGKDDGKGRQEFCNSWPCDECVSPEECRAFVSHEADEFGGRCVKCGMSFDQCIDSDEPCKGETHNGQE